MNKHQTLSPIANKTNIIESHINTILRAALQEHIDEAGSFYFDESVNGKVTCSELEQSVMDKYGIDIQTADLIDDSYFEATLKITDEFKQILDSLQIRISGIICDSDGEKSASITDADEMYSVKITSIDKTKETAVYDEVIAQLETMIVKRILGFDD